MTSVTGGWINHIGSLALATLAALLITVIWALPGAASATGNEKQTEASVTFSAGGGDYHLVAFWTNPSDPTQDGSAANPFSPGSQVELRVESRGAINTIMMLRRGGRAPYLNGAGLFMPVASHKELSFQRYSWNPESRTIHKLATPYVQGLATIHMQASSVSGGLATWRFDNAQLGIAGWKTYHYFNVPQLSGSFYISPSADMLPDPPVEEELPSESAELVSAREQVRLATEQLEAATTALAKKRARADKLSERFRKADQAYESALAKRDKAALSHQEAVAKANRLAQAAVDKGAKAQARADEAAAVADRRFDRLTKRDAELQDASEARDTAKEKADRALAEAKAALAKQTAAAEALSTAEKALTALESPIV